VIAVASGKGGVGKSSITVNLAAALARQGHRVGVLDADIWGYSIPRMFGVSGKPVAFDGMVMPLQAHGCKVISIGFFTDPDRSVIWRGPMLHRALQQFLGDVHWGELDFLLCDLPPGTGDIAISLAQMLPNADMVVVTTPQQAAQKVALRAGKATEQTGMKVAGVIENMALFTCPDCGTAHDCSARVVGGARRGARHRPARPHPDRSPAARGWRRGRAARPVAPRRARRAGDHRHRRAAGGTVAVAGRSQPAAQRVVSRPRGQRRLVGAVPREQRLARLSQAPRDGSGAGDVAGPPAVARQGERGREPGGAVQRPEVGDAADQAVDGRTTRPGQGPPEPLVHVRQPAGAHREVAATDGRDRPDDRDAPATSRRRH
jgi:Mrp family chromosome partitioning ATPase